MPSNSLRTRLPSRRVVRYSALLTIAILGLSRGIPAATASISSQSTVVLHATAVPLGQPVLLADEITRRLRRMGISFSHTRLPHPYDPVGEVC